MVPANDALDFDPDAEALRELLVPEVKGVMLNNPNNPTGKIYSRKALDAVADVLREAEERFGHTIYLICDEPYRELVYDGTEVPYLTKYYSDTFVCYSYSKSLSLPGERIGYVVIPDEMTDAEDVKSAVSLATRILGFVNAPSLMQLVAAENVDAEVNVSAYDKNRKALYKGLTGLGFECVEPEGAFYLFMKSPIDDDKTFCDMAKAENILLVPGSAFGCPGYVRIAYCVSYETIIRSLPGFEKLSGVFGLVQE